MLEILVVLALIGLAIGIFVARGPMRSPALEVQAATNEIAGALRGARARAIASDQPVAFMLDAARHEYRAEGIAHPLPASVTVALTAPGGLIRFLPDGSSSGGRVLLGFGGHAASVSVDWLTGRVSIGP